MPARRTLAADKAALAGKKPTAKVHSAPLVICMKPYRPEAAPIICGSELMALVTATGPEAPTPTEKMIIGTSTVARLSKPLAAAAKNKMAPNRGIALVADIR